MKRNIKNNLSEFIFNLIKNKIENIVLDILSKFFGKTESIHDKEEKPLLVSLPEKFYPKFSNDFNVIDISMYRNLELNNLIKDHFNIIDSIPDSDPPKSVA